MVTKQEVRTRAKEIIAADPTAGKNRINTLLRLEYGVGLRSSTVLELKREVATEKPALYPELYARGSVPKGYGEIYRGWLASGFLPFEARELTIGHGGRYKAFDAKAVYDSKPGELAREERQRWIKDLLSKGWTRKQIKDEAIDYYVRGRKRSPWDFVRKEYRRDKKKDFVDYKAKAARRASRHISDLGKGRKRR